MKRAIFKEVINKLAQPYNNNHQQYKHDILDTTQIGYFIVFLQLIERTP